MLDGVCGQRHAPAALPPGKRPGTHCAGGWVGPRAGLDGCGKSLPPPPTGFHHRTVQPVASCYTDWAIAARVVMRKLYVCSGDCAPSGVQHGTVGTVGDVVRVEQGTTVYRNVGCYSHSITLVGPMWEHHISDRSGTARVWAIWSTKSEMRLLCVVCRFDPCSPLSDTFMRLTDYCVWKTPLLIPTTKRLTSSYSIVLWTLHKRSFIFK